MTVPVPVTLLFHRITYKGFTQTSLLGGIVDITTPLDPVIDDRILRPARDRRRSGGR